MNTQIIYLSIPIIYCDEANIIETRLSLLGFKVYNPCRVILPDIPKESMPGYIAKQCYRLIDLSDVVILFADYYGRDCAAEIGYSIAHKKIIIPYSKSGNDSPYLQQDWMIRSMIHPISRSIEELTRNLVWAYENVEEKNG